MKKVYTLIGLAIIGSAVFSGKAAAQITLSQSDMPTVSTTFATAYDTLTSSVSALSPGAKGSTTWGFGTLPTNYTTADVFANPAVTPYASHFTTSNLADSIVGTIGYNYISSTSSAFTIIGSEQSIQGNLVAVVFNNPITELSFPANYTNITGGSATASIPAFHVTVTGLPIDSAKGSITTTYADTIDAYGSLTTPLSGGTTYPALRQKHYEVDIDSIFIYETGAGWQYFAPESGVTKSYSYRWYTNGLGSLLATMQMDTTNSKVTSMQWYDGLPTGINEISQAHSTLVYPNPATSQINFHYSAQNAQNIFVYDITGRQLSQTEMKNGIATLNTSAYAGGIYFYHITDKAGAVLDNGKFSIL